MMNAGYPYTVDNTACFRGGSSLEKMSGIYDLSSQLVATNTMDILLDSIVRQSVEILHVKFTRVITPEPDGSFICRASHSSDALDLSNLRWRKAMPVAEAFYRRVLMSEIPIIIGQGNTLPNSLRIALRLSYFETMYLIPLRVNNEAVGILALGEELRQVSEGDVKEKIRVATLIADQAASAIYRAGLSSRLEESQLQTVLSLAKVIESRDAYIGDHCRKVTSVAVRLAHKLNFSPAEVQLIRWASLLHDIGKVGIPDYILWKQGPLDPEEWKIIRQHPEKGADIVRMSSNLSSVAELILAHHEWYDGHGYPNGLKGEQIPLGSRVMAVADAYSAMTDNRTYRSGCSMDQVLKELVLFSGKQFDPQVVEAFVSLFA